MKFKVHPLTYFILFSILICGYFNYFLIVSIILLFHDLGHLIIMKIYKVKIIGIEILPFGSIINTSINYNMNSNKLFLISSGGVLMQLLLYIVFYLLYNYGIISLLSYQIFLTYNKMIILFNILPIIPLDGSKVFLSIIERFWSFKSSIKIVNIISIVSIIVFIFTNTISLNLIFISLFLLFKTYSEIVNHSYIFNKFLLERYLYGSNYSKIINVPSIKKIYKNRFNFINNEREDKILAKLFDNNNYF